ERQQDLIAGVVRVKSQYTAGVGPAPGFSWQQLAKSPFDDLLKIVPKQLVFAQELQSRIHAFVEPLRAPQQGEHKGQALPPIRIVFVAILEGMRQRYQKRAIVDQQEASQAGLQAVFVRLQASNRRSEEHTSELQSRFDIVCRLLL